MTEQRIQHGELAIAKSLFDLVNNDVAPGTGVEPKHFWDQFEQIMADLMPKNQALLAKRDAIQAKIDVWHQANRNADFAAYKTFLTDIGYLVPEGADFAVSPDNVDDEIATIAPSLGTVDVLFPNLVYDAMETFLGSYSGQDRNGDSAVR